MVTKRSTVNKNISISINIYEDNNIYEFDSNHQNINQARKSIINMLNRRKTIKK